MMHMGRINKRMNLYIILLNRKEIHKTRNILNVREIKVFLNKKTSFVRTEKWGFP